MRAHGLSAPAENETRLGSRVEEGAVALAELLDAGRPITAAVVANVNAALGVVREARSRGLRVPEDLSVVSIHDAMTAEHAWPPLTAVRMPLGYLGRSAIRMLLQAIGVALQPEPEGLQAPQPQLILRQSTAQLI